jgi:hypothetical protein
MNVIGVGGCTDRGVTGPMNVGVTGPGAGVDAAGDGAAGVGVGLARCLFPLAGGASVVAALGPALGPALGAALGLPVAGAEARVALGDGDAA